jgi:hypothetical protein
MGGPGEGTLKDEGILAEKTNPRIGWLSTSFPLSRYFMVILLKYGIDIPYGKSIFANWRC